MPPSSSSSTWPTASSRPWPAGSTGTSRLPVVIAVDGERLTPGTVHGTRRVDNLLVRPGLLVALARPPARQFNVPGVDAAFASAAELLGAAPGASLLTGMGRDGAIGLPKLRAGPRVHHRPGRADVSSSGACPPPRRPLDAVDVELPLPEIPAAIVKAVERVSPAPGDFMSPALADADFQALRRYLRQTAGLEFDDSRRTSLAHVMTERFRVSGRGGHVRLPRAARPAGRRCRAGSCRWTPSPSRRRSSIARARRSTRCATTCCRMSSS